MGQVKVCRTDSAVDIWAAFLVSVVTVIVLIFFDIETFLRYIHLDPDQVVFLAYTLHFIIVAQISCIYWIHIRNNTTRELELLERFLNHGKIIVGDVHYPSDETSGCFSTSEDRGLIVYRHPMAQYKGCFVRKGVTLVEKCSRELETMLILPNEPYSAQPKSEVQSLLAIGRKRYQITRILGIYSLLVFLFCLLSAGFTLFVMTSLEKNSEFEYDFWRRYLVWIIFAVSVVLIPSTAVFLSVWKWGSFVKWLRRGNARFVQDGDEEYSHLVRLPSGMTDITVKTGT